MGDLLVRFGTILRSISTRTMSVKELTNSLALTTHAREARALYIGKKAGEDAFLRGQLDAKHYLE